MATLIFTDLNNSNKKKNIYAAVCSIIIALGTVMCASDLFSLGYGIRTAFSGGVLSGLVNGWNGMAEALGISDYVLLPEFESAGEGCGLFLTFSVCVLAVIAFLIIKSEKAWGLVIFPLPLIFVNVFFDLWMGSVSMAILALGVFSAAALIKNRGNGFLKAFITLMIVSVVTVSCLNIDFIASLNGGGTGVDKIREGVKNSLSNIYYGESPLGEGDLTRSERGDTEGTALEITMSEPSSMYLRGFVGETYTGTEWTPLANGAYFSERNLFYWLKQEGFNALGQAAQADALTKSEAEEDISVTIETKDASSEYAYIPYGITSDIADTREYGGSFITGGKLKRISSYEYTAAQDPSKTWTDIAARLFAGAEAADQSELGDYLKKESHYNDFVYRNYRYLSQNDRELLSTIFGSIDVTEGHVDYKEAIEKIRSYLEENFIYTENTGDEKISSSLASFINSGKGYDVQYATAATLMFRHMGIPARYVEGYLVTPEDAEDMKAGEAYELPSDRVHAWTEIYIDGTGFVPVEVTPEYYGIMEEADMTVGISNNSLVRSFEEQSGGSSSENLHQSGGDEKQLEIINIIFIALLIVLSLAILALLIWLAMKALSAIKKYRQRMYTFNKAEPKIAVSAIFDYMEDKAYPVKDEARNLGNVAAYSRKPLGEEQRSEMLGYLSEARKEYRENADRKKP